jgi:oxygen-dependent protoporphyrinogen oxidase
MRFESLRAMSESVMLDTMSKKIIVIGGGVAGTSAAHTLVGHGYDVTIIERQDRLGGRVRSELVSGAAVEMGAGFLSQGYTNLLGLMATTGLDRRLYRAHGSSGIFRDGQIHMITPKTLLGSKPLSWAAKLHAVPLLLKTLINWRQLDAHAFWKANAYDTQSVADMVSSKSGKEFLEYALQPVLNGYFYWTPEHTSEAMMRVLCKAAFSHGTYKMRGGLQRIPEKAAEGSRVLFERTVRRVEQTAAGSYDVTVDYHGEKQTLHADGIICATTATVVPSIFPSLSKPQKEFFGSIQYSSGALTAQTYRRDQTHGDKAIAFPRKEGIELASVTLAQEPGSNDTVYATVKTYASGIAAAQVAALSDQELINRLTGDTAPVHDTILIDNPSPVATHIQRWPEALPFFDVGHFQRLHSFERGEIEDQEQPVAFAGDYLGGPFMEGAFTSGVQAAERLDARLRK